MVFSSRSFSLARRMFVLLAGVTVLLFTVSGCAFGPDRTDIDADGEMIDTVTELDVVADTQQDEDTGDEAANPTDTPSPEPLVPTDTPTPTYTIAPTSTPKATATSMQATATPKEDSTPEVSEQRARTVAQAESPLDVPEAAQSPLATPSVAISPLATPTQPASPLLLEEEPAPVFIVPQVTEIEAEVADGASYVRGRLMSNVSGSALTREVVRLPEIICPELEDESGMADNEVDSKAKGAPSPAELMLEKESEAAEAGEDCFWVLADALTAGAITDSDGYFEFVDLTPGDYIFLVGDMMTLYAFALEDVDTPFQFTAPEDGAIDLGDVYVDFE